MIDLDQLDAKLERALSEEVRAMRGFAPPAGAPARSLAERDAAATPVPPPPRPMEPLTAEDDWTVVPWDLDEPAPRPDVDGPPSPPPARAARAAAPAPAPAAAPRDAAPAPPAPPRPATPTRIGPSSLPTFESGPVPPPRPAPRAAPAPRPTPASRPAPASAPTRPPLAQNHAGTSARERLRLAAAAVNGHRPGSLRSDDAVAEIRAHLAQGRLADAERVAARHPDPTFHVMRAILQGREQQARSGLQAVQSSQAHNDQAAWTQRLWIALTFGGEDEQYDVLEHCRERAYRYDDVVWRGALALVLARMGRSDEATRELDATAGRLDVIGQEQRADVVTNLVEAAFLLGDGRRAAGLAHHLAAVKDPVVVVGRAWVCKGSLARYRGMIAATTGRAREADQCFEQAVGTHRAMSASPLLARAEREREQLRLTASASASAHALAG